jgi:hypothetical protein
MFRSQVKEYDTRHGGAFDRGAADSYYSRPRDPHYYSGATSTSNRVIEPMMTADQVKAYHAGYDHNERYGDKKSWD